MQCPQQSALVQMPPDLNLDIWCFLDQSNAAPVRAGMSDLCVCLLESPPPREKEPGAALVGPIGITVGLDQLRFFLPGDDNSLKHDEKYERREVLSKEDPSDSEEDGCQVHRMPDVRVRSSLN